MVKKRRQRISRDNWLEAGLELLADQGVHAVKIDHLARRLGVAKTGFYWHFKNRRALLDAMLEFWEREYTTVVTESPGILSLPAADRLQAINQMVQENFLSEYDLAIAHWAQHDEKAARCLADTIAERMKFVGEAFRELGFKSVELEMRTRLYVCYTSWSPHMFGNAETARDRRIRVMRNKLLIAPLSDD